MSENDERRPGQGGGSSSGLARHPHTTDDVRQNATRRTDPLHVFAHGYLVVGTRGRCRLVMIVPRCPYCQGRPHVHNGKPSFQQGTRTASCHGGSYVVHLDTVEGEVTAA